MRATRARDFRVHIPILNHACPRRTKHFQTVSKRDYEAVYDKIYDNSKSLPEMTASTRILICRDIAIKTLDRLVNM